MPETAPSPEAIIAGNSGKQTTEYYVAKAVLYVGLGITLLGGVTEILQGVLDVFPHAQGVGRVMAMIGIASTALTQLVYTVGRVFLKAQALKSQALTVEAAKSVIDKS